MDNRKYKFGTEIYSPENIAKQNCKNCPNRTDFDVCLFWLDYIPDKPELQTCAAWGMNRNDVDRHGIGG